MSLFLQATLPYCFSFTHEMISEKEAYTGLNVCRGAGFTKSNRKPFVLETNFVDCYIVKEEGTGGRGAGGGGSRGYERTGTLEICNNFTGTELISKCRPCNGALVVDIVIATNFFPISVVQYLLSHDASSGGPLSLGLFFPIPPPSSLPLYSSTPPPPRNLWVNFQLLLSLCLLLFTRKCASSLNLIAGIWKIKFLTSTNY